MIEMWTFLINVIEQNFLFVVVTIIVILWSNDVFSAVL